MRTAFIDLKWYRDVPTNLPGHMPDGKQESVGTVDFMHASTQGARKSFPTLNRESLSEYNSIRVVASRG